LEVGSADECAFFWSDQDEARLVTIGTNQYLWSGAFAIDQCGECLVKLFHASKGKPSSSILSITDCLLDEFVANMTPRIPLQFIRFILIEYFWLF
jgi:hypothetical protein